MENRISQINDTIAELRQQIIAHPVYTSIQHIDDFKTFMEYHIFAVWDFMSLLKSLQRNLTCTTIPWFPVGDAQTRYLINEIVAGEESDVDETGIRMSHFELYLNAMQQIGASTEEINLFLENLKSGFTVSEALQMQDLAPEIRDFVGFTFEIIYSQKPHLQAAIFTFGREDLIPDMFLAMIRDLKQDHPEKVTKFQYYLERHIEVDGDHHSHLALEMTALLCGDSDEKWEEATTAVKRSLEMRIGLWNGVLKQIEARKTQLISEIDGVN